MLRYVRPIRKALHLVPRVLLWGACMIYFLVALLALPDRAAGLLQRIGAPVRTLIAGR